MCVQGRARDAPRSVHGLTGKPDVSGKTIPNNFRVFKDALGMPLEAFMDTQKNLCCSRVQGFVLTCRLILVFKKPLRRSANAIQTVE